jgi:hypothetical protein
MHALAALMFEIAFLVVYVSVRLWWHPSKGFGSPPDDRTTEGVPTLDNEHGIRIYIFAAVLALCHLLSPPARITLGSRFEVLQRSVPGLLNPPLLTWLSYILVSAESTSQRLMKPFFLLSQ